MKQNNTRSKLLSIGSRLSLAIGSIQIVLFTVLYFSASNMFERFIDNQIKYEILQISGVFNSTLAPHLFAQDFGAAQHLLSELEKQLPMLVYASANDILGYEAASIGTKTPPLEATNNQAIHFTKIDIKLNTQSVGSAEVGIVLTNLNTLKAEFSRNISIIATLIILLSVILIILISKYYTKGISQLAINTRILSNGEFPKPIQEKLHHEVQELALCFDHMVHSIKGRTQDLEMERAHMSALLEAMKVGIVFDDNESVIHYANSAFSSIWRIDSAVINQNIDHIISQSPSNILTTTPQPAPLGINKLVELTLDDGRLITETCIELDALTFQQGRLRLYEDITAEKQTQSKLLYLAETDVLTGLNNRHKFHLELERMSAMADRYKHTLALIFFDLDDFKAINDTFGHNEGDNVLIRIAQTIGNLVRRNEILCRLGGDEFALLSLCDDEREIHGLADRITTMISQLPFEFMGQPTRISCSVGVSLYPSLSSNTDDLVTHADIAMYKAKSKGKNTYSVYDPCSPHIEESLERFSWVERIQNAFDKNLFEVHFQGVYDCESSNISHLEALIRLRESEYSDTLVSPGEFIPIAEKTGKILAIDRFVIHECVQILKNKPNAPSIAINISGRSFDEPSLPKYIGDEISTAGIDSSRLLIELTETEAVSDIRDARRFIDQLHQLGCKVCLDDFGSGFSSFTYLKHLEVDILKIDGQFIRELDSSNIDELFVKSMLLLAKGMGKKTIAEFVENEAILEKLKHLGADMGQGYHLDKPIKDHPALQ